MRWALARNSRDVLRRWMSGETLLAFDFDGTLAPIVNDPDRAHMRVSTRRLLRRLAAAYPCVVISGRARAEVRDKLAGTGIRRIIGNHGAELWERAPEMRRQVAHWRASLERGLPALPGMRIEDKKLSLTVHYRQCRWKAKAREAILQAAGSLPEVRVIGGKQAISLVPRNAPNKGTALKAELTHLGYQRALYAGDEETDEDVFALGGALCLLSIRVGRKADSQAAYYLRNQREMDDLLRSLVDCG